MIKVTDKFQKGYDFLTILSVIVLISIGWYLYVSQTSDLSLKGVDDPGTSVYLYFYNPDLDQGPGGVQCSKKGLVAVERVLPKTVTPLKESIELLLRGELSDKEREQGLSTEFPLSGLSLKSVELVQGVATLIFDDPQHKTGGGSCRVAILWSQIEATAKQFSTVTSVRFMPEELFQP